MVSRTDMINVYDVKLKRFTHGYLSLPRTGAKCLSMGYISVCGGGIADGGTVDKGVQWQKEGQRYVVVYTGVIQLAVAAACFKIQKMALVFGVTRRHWYWGLSPDRTRTRSSPLDD